MTRHLARLLDAPAVLCHVSRLVIDANRKPGDPSSIPVISDGTLVPGNQDLSPEQVRWRLRRFFLPYHRAVARQIARLRRRRRAGDHLDAQLHAAPGHTWRPWHAAVLWDTDPRLAAPVLAGLRREPGLHVGDNEPYSGRYPVGYSIPFHAARPRLPHVTFEIRQDLIDTRRGGGLGGAARRGLARTAVRSQALRLERELAPQGQAMPLTAPSLTLGLEEEYLLVDPTSRDLVAAPPAEFMQRCQERLGERVTHEFLQAQVEVGTSGVPGRRRRPGAARGACAPSWPPPRASSAWP